MLASITASTVLYEQSEDEVRPLFESLSREAALSAWAVVDNGGSREALATAASLGARCFHPTRNLGFGAGNNLALRELLSLGKYHLFVNPDISLQPGVLQGLHEFMESHLDIGLAMPRILYPDGSEQRLCKLLPSPFDLFLRRFLGSAGKLVFRSRWDAYEMRDLDMGISREVPSLSGCFMFVRSSVLREVGLFDERYFMYMEDVDLCRRIGNRYKTAFCPRVAVVHGYAKGSYGNSRLLRYHLRSAVRYFNKWGWLHDAERKRLNARVRPVAGGEVSNLDGTS